MRTKGGLWRLSPSGLYGYTECKSCFWVDNHYKKAPMLPLLLNSAMDSILKSRYDKYRVEGAFPPESSKLTDEGIQPFTDLEQLNEWREKIAVLRVINRDDGYQLQGKIDDVLMESDGRLVPADYKSSGKAPAEDKQKYYRDQLTAYGFMFSRHGHPVSNRAYLLHYFVKDKTDPALEVAFESCVDRVEIDVDEIEHKLKAMVGLLDAPYPGPNPECGQCDFYEGRRKYC